MKKTLLAIAALTALTSGAAMAQQQDGKWMVRARAVHIDSANKDSTGLGLSVSNKTIPEIDVSYFFTPNFAAELILTYPQKHDVRANGLGKIGSVKELPPTLLAQYHFTTLGAFKPYVGAGINYTRFASAKFDPAINAALQPSVKSNSWGGALQVGFDYALDKNWSINFDVKKVYMKTDIYSFGAKAGTLKIDPVLVGVGIGYRF